MPRRKRVEPESLLTFFRSGWRKLSNDDPNVTTGKVEIVVNGIFKRMSALEFWEKVVLEVDMKLKRRRKGYDKLPILTFPPEDNQSSSSGDDSFRRIYGTYLHHIIVGRNDWFRYHVLPEKTKLIQILLHNVDNCNKINLNLQMKLINALKASPTGTNFPIFVKEKNTVEKDNLETQVAMETEPVLEEKTLTEELPRQELNDTPTTSPDDSSSKQCPEQTQFPDTPPLSHKESLGEEFTKTRVKSQKRMRRKRTPKVIKTSTEDSSISEEKRKARRRTRREGRRYRQRYHREHRYAMQTQTHVSILPSNPNNTVSQPVEWTYGDNIPVYGQIPAPTWNGYMVPENQLVCSEGPYQTYDGQQLPIQNVYYPAQQHQFYPQNNYLYVPPEQMFLHNPNVQILPYQIPEYPQGVITHPLGPQVVQQPIVYLPQYQVVQPEQYPQQNLAPCPQEENLEAVEMDNNVALPPESSSELNSEVEENTQDTEMLAIEEQVQDLTISSGIDENAAISISTVEEINSAEHDSSALPPESSSGLNSIVEENTQETEMLAIEEQVQDLTISSGIEENAPISVSTAEEINTACSSARQENDEIFGETQFDETRPGEQEQKEGGSILGTDVKHEEEKRVILEAEEVELLNNLTDERKDTPRKSIPKSEISKIEEYIKKWGTIPPRMSISNNPPFEYMSRDIRQLSSTLRVSEASVGVTYTARDNATQTSNGEEDFENIDQETQTDELSKSLPTYAEIARKQDK